MKASKVLSKIWRLEVMLLYDDCMNLIELLLTFFVSTLSSPRSPLRGLWYVRSVEYMAYGSTCPVAIHMCCIVLSTYRASIHTYHVVVCIHCVTMHPVVGLWIHSVIMCHFIMCMCHVVMRMLCVIRGHSVVKVVPCKMTLETNSLSYFDDEKS